MMYARDYSSNVMSCHRLLDSTRSGIDECGLENRNVLLLVRLGQSADIGVNWDTK